tara:strand:- start:9503 stop:9826 length:324 start_codon:yes stop_codon:yes gene_type:complete
MKKERYEALKRMAASGSGASDNERLIAEALMGQADDIHEAIKKSREPRITVSKGISGNSLVVRRKDGKGAVTIMMPVDEYAAVEFCNSSLRIRLTDEEEYIVCEKLN